MKSRDEYISGIVNPVGDAITQSAFRVAIDSVKAGMSEAMVCERVSATVYTAACRIAQNAAYVRKARDTAEFMTGKLPQVQRIAYNTALNASKVIHDIEYCDPNVQSHMVSALMREVAESAKSSDGQESIENALKTISNPKDPYCATHVLVREAAQRVFQDDDEVTRATVTMFEVIKICYDFFAKASLKLPQTTGSGYYHLDGIKIAEKIAGQSSASVYSEARTTLIRELVLEQATNFAQALQALDSAADDKYAELNATCDAIVIQQAVFTAESVHAARKGYATAARRTCKRNLVNNGYLFVWAWLSSHKQAGSTTKLIGESMKKYHIDLQEDAGKSLAYLESKLAHYSAGFTLWFPSSREVQQRTPSMFDVEKSQLISMLSSVETDGEKGKTLLLVQVFTWATRCMICQFPFILSFFKDCRLTDEQAHFLAFESTVYLFFNSDLWAFSFGQTDDSRAAFEEVIWQSVLAAFTSTDKSLQALIEQRLDEYTNSHQSKSRMCNPAGVFLDHLKVLVDTGSVNRSRALPRYSAFDRAIDWSMIQQMQCFYLFLGCLRTVFSATTNLSELSADEMKDLLLSAARTAIPLDLSPKEKVEKELNEKLEKALAE